MKIEIPVEVILDTHKIVKSMSREELFEYIQELDIYVAEVDFTLKLVTWLINSVREDMNDDDFREFITQFIKQKVNLPDNCRICENCNRDVNINTNIGHDKYCNYVYGRRGWRQLEKYNG